jgi:hypothetical protein
MPCGKETIMHFSKIVVLAIAGTVTLNGCSAHRAASPRGATRVSKSHEYRVPPRHQEEFHPRNEVDESDADEFESDIEYQNEGPAVPPAPFQDPEPAPAATGVSRVKRVGYKKPSTPSVPAKTISRSSAACAEDGESCGTIERETCTSDESCGSYTPEPASPRCGLFKSAGKKFRNLFRREEYKELCVEDECACSDDVQVIDPETCTQAPCGELPCREDQCAATDWEECISKCQENATDSLHAGCGDTGAPAYGLIRPDGCGDSYHPGLGETHDRRPCLAESLRDPFLDLHCDDESVSAPPALQHPDSAELPITQPLQKVPATHDEPAASDFPLIQVPGTTEVPAVPQSTNGAIEPPVWRGPRERQMIQPRISTISSQSTGMQVKGTDANAPHIAPRGRK